MYVLKVCKYLRSSFELLNQLLNSSNCSINKIVDYESFLESNSPDIFDLCETNLNGSITSSNFSVRGYLLLIWKDSSTYMDGLTVYVKEGLPFKQDLSLENSADSYVCFWLASLHSVNYFFFLYWSPSLSSGFPIVREAWGAPPHLTIYFEPLPPKSMPPPLKNEAPHLKNKPPSHWNIKHPSMKWFLEKAQ